MWSEIDFLTIFDNGVDVTDMCLDCSCGHGVNGIQVCSTQTFDIFFVSQRVRGQGCALPVFSASTPRIGTG